MIAAESVACLNKALCHLKDIWEEIGIPEDQRLERTNVVKNHVKVSVECNDVDHLLDPVKTALVVKLTKLLWFRVFWTWWSQKKRACGNVFWQVSRHVTKRWVNYAWSFSFPCFRQAFTLDAHCSPWKRKKHNVWLGITLFMISNVFRRTEVTLYLSRRKTSGLTLKWW